MALRSRELLLLISAIAALLLAPRPHIQASLAASGACACCPDAVPCDCGCQPGSTAPRGDAAVDGRCACSAAPALPSAKPKLLLERSASVEALAYRPGLESSLKAAAHLRLITHVPLCCHSRQFVILQI